MNSKKLFIVFAIFMVSLFIGTMVSYAECSDCTPGKCSECGCVENKSNTACIYHNYSSSTVSCGIGLIDKIPSAVPKVISIGYTLIQIAVPVVLVIFGSLDLFKGITAQKEDEIKKGQQTFIKRLISAVLVFFVFVIVKFVISVAADASNSEILDCAECFIQNKCTVG